MLGGVIGGYCAIGSLKAATAPARVMTIDRTAAKNRSLDEEMREHECPDRGLG